MSACEAWTWKASKRFRIVSTSTVCLLVGLFVTAVTNKEVFHKLKTAREKDPNPPLDELFTSNDIAGLRQQTRVLT